MKIKIIFGITILALCFSCSEKDNFAEPDATLQGAVIDVETGDSIPSAQPEGMRIRLYDQGYTDPQPINFWVKQDGSFRDTRLFEGKYKAVVENGGFYGSSDTLIVDVPTEEDIRFEVLPYLRLRISTEFNNRNQLIVTSKIEKTNSDDGKIIERGIFVNRTKYVDFNNFINDNPVVNTRETDDAELLGDVIVDTISVDDFENQPNLYIRIGAKTDLKDVYNYSKVLKVEH